MKKLYVAQGLMYALCLGFALMSFFGVSFTSTRLGLILGNTLALLYFAPMVLTLTLAWGQWEEGPVRLVRMTAVIVLCLSVIMFLLMYVFSVLNVPVAASSVLMILWFLLNIPAANCSASFLLLYFFCWSLLLFSAHTEIGKMRHR